MSSTYLFCILSVFGLAVSPSCDPPTSCPVTSGTITCESGSCNIDCMGAFDCEQYNIICNADTVCSVTCHESQSCKRANIDALHALDLTVTATGCCVQHLYYAVIMCPDNGPEGGKVCHIGSTVANPTQLYYHAIINAVEGFNDVEFSGLSGDSLYAAELRCRADYQARCFLDASSLTTCSGAAATNNASYGPSYCEFTPSPTANPTEVTLNPSSAPSKYPSEHPTYIPTANPTINPTINPSHDPSSNLTINPSHDPSSNPTINPTLSPTKYPSSNPSNIPSIAGDAEVPDVTEHTLSPIETANSGNRTDSDSADVAWIIVAVLGVLLCVTFFVALFLYKKVKGPKQQQLNNAGNVSEMAEIQRIHSDDGKTRQKGSIPTTVTVNDEDVISDVNKLTPGEEPGNENDECAVNEMLNTPKDDMDIVQTINETTM